MNEVVQTKGAMLLAHLDVNISKWKLKFIFIFYLKPKFLVSNQRLAVSELLNRTVYLPQTHQQKKFPPGILCVWAQPPGLRPSHPPCSSVSVERSRTSPGGNAAPSAYSLLNRDKHSNSDHTLFLICSHGSCKCGLASSIAKFLHHNNEITLHIFNSIRNVYLCLSIKFTNSFF